MAHLDQEMPDAEFALIAPEQLRAARAMARWSQEDLSQKSGVPVRTIKRLESQTATFQTKFDTIHRLARALEEVVSFEDNEDSPGVRLKPRS